MLAFTNYELTVPQVVDACVESSSSSSTMRQALQFAGDVLGVMCDAQQLAVLDLGSQLSQVCTCFVHSNANCMLSWVGIPQACMLHVAGIGGVSMGPM